MLKKIILVSMLLANINLLNAKSFSVINGTGKTIKEISFRASPEKYGNIDLVYSLKPNLQDKDVTLIELPEELDNFSDFDVIIEYGTFSKNAKTKTSVSIKDGQDILAYIDGKKSSVPIIAGGGAGAATAVVAATGISVASALWGAGGITYYLALAGSVIGGGMVAGISIIAAAPVAIGVSAFAIANKVTSDTLIMLPVKVEG